MCGLVLGQLRGLHRVSPTETCPSVLPTGPFVEKDASHFGKVPLSLFPFVD